MKILLTSIVGVIFVAVLYLPWQQPAPLLPTAGTSVVVFGDSLAEGVGATPGNDIASQLEVVLEQPVLNLGRAGDTTGDGLARMNTLLAVDPKVVIVILGGNDAIQRIDTETTFANLASIIEQIQAVGAAVVLVGEPGGLFDRQFEREYARLAETYRTFYVSNILDGLIGRPEYMSDLVHPNDAGYRQAVLRILPEVEKALGR